MLPFAGAPSFFRSFQSRLSVGLGMLHFDAQDVEAGQYFDMLAPALCTRIGVTLFDELASCMAELDFKGARQLLEPYGTREKYLPT